MDDQQQSRWRPTRRQLLWASGIVAVLAVSILIGYRYDITLWDWLKLLVVPAVITGGGLWFNRQQRERELETAREQREREVEIADRRAQDEALQAYLDQIGQLLLDKDRPLRHSEEDDEVRTLARARSRTVLTRLGEPRKGSVLEFLYESDLIAKDCVVVDLRGAALDGTDLTSAKMPRLALVGAILRGAKLPNANFMQANLSEADLRNAVLYETNLSEADLSKARLDQANLTGTNLSEANLSGANLSGSTLIYADLSHARLSRAHLKGADLRNAKLKRVDFSGAFLESALLEGASLSEARQDHQLPGCLRRSRRQEALRLRQEQRRGTQGTTRGPCEH